MMHRNVRAAYQPPQEVKYIGCHELTDLIETIVLGLIVRPVNRLG
jgi:hypothetical protein